MQENGVVFNQPAWRKCDSEWTHKVPIKLTIQRGEVLNGRECLRLNTRKFESSS